MENPVHRGSAPLFDYDSALAADNAMWGAGKQRSQVVRDGIAAGVDLVKRSANAYGRAFEKAGDALVKSYENVKKFPDVLQSGWDKALTLLPDSGGYTFALGVSGGYEAGFGAQGAKGDLVTIDFESKKVITASYWSAQGGSNVGIPAADVGAEFTYFRSERFRDIFEGTYNATGGQVAAGVGVTVDKITTMPKIGDPIMHGWQATVGFGTPQADIHTHFGYGGIIKGTYQETKFSDIPANIWRHLWF